MDEREKRFTRIYEVNGWGNGESVSGPGSTERYTRGLRRALPVLFRRMGVHSILDAPCGDFNWFQHIEFDPKLDYTGGDVVQDLVDRNNDEFAEEGRKFIKLDVTKDDLPAADLWLCRDLFLHLPLHDIRLVLDNFVRSRITYILASSYPLQRRNNDLAKGALTRFVDLQTNPFFFGLPLTRIPDWIPGFTERYLLLYSRSQVQYYLGS